MHHLDVVNRTRCESRPRQDVWIWAAATALGVLAGLVEGLVKALRLAQGLPRPMRFDILFVAPATYALGAGLFAALALAALRLVSLALPADSESRRSTWLVETVPVALTLGPVSFYAFWSLFRLGFRTSRTAEALLILGLAIQATRLLVARRRWRSLANLLPATLGLCALIALLVRGGYAVAERRREASLPSARPGAPNVLLITLDTLRADHLSAYGYARGTPHLDRLAREGALYEHAFAPSSWTLPSHASLMTGRRVWEHRADMNTGQRLDGRFPTLAEVFSQNGYRSAAFVANQVYCAASQGFARGFVRFDDIFFRIDESVAKTELGLAFLERSAFGGRPRNRIRVRRSAREINFEFLTWLSESSPRPFFVWLNYMEPHAPFYAPPPFQRRYGRRPANGIPEFRGTLPGWSGPEPPEAARPLIDAYDCAIAYLDDAIGQLHDALSEKGLLERTIVVVTSDHGEGFGEHGLFDHGNSLFREAIHVPLLVRYPPAIRPGTRHRAPLDLCAVPATVLSLAGLPPGTFPGSSFQDGGGGVAVSELLRNPYQPSAFQASAGDVVSIVTSEWHAIFFSGGVRLFELPDAREQTDLASTPRGRAAIQSLRLQLARALPGREP